MFDAMLKLGNWLQNTGLGLWVARTDLYPWVQFTHFAGLSLWVGTIWVLDLCVLGCLGLRQNVGQLAEQITPLTWTGLGIAITGGFLMFSGNAQTYLLNSA